MSRDRDELAAAFENLASWCTDTAPLYERLCAGVADDPEVLAVADAAPPDRSAPHLLLAAVHYLLLDGADAPELAAHYPTVDGPESDPDAGTGPDTDTYPAFRSFCLDHADAVRELVATRRTQTNAVGRSAALYPAVCHVASRYDDRPLALVEIGTSAGLNLLLDRYRYDYGDGRECGPADSPVRIEAAVRGEADPPLHADPPAVASRAGLDLNPLDVRDPEDATWLRALVWPEHPRRHRYLAAAIDLAREDPPPLVRGDALDSLAGLVGALPEDRPICLYDTSVMYQLPEERRERLRERVRDLGTDRPLHWLSNEGTYGDDDGLLLWHRRVVDGELRERRRLAYEQHGRWVRWLG